MLLAPCKQIKVNARVMWKRPKSRDSFKTKQIYSILIMSFFMASINVLDFEVPPDSLLVFVLWFFPLQQTSTPLEFIIVVVSIVTPPGCIF